MRLERRQELFERVDVALQLAAAPCISRAFACKLFIVGGQQLDVSPERVVHASGDGVTSTHNAAHGRSFRHIGARLRSYSSIAPPRK